MKNEFVSFSVLIIIIKIFYFIENLKLETGRRPIFSNNINKEPFSKVFNVPLHIRIN